MTTHEREITSPVDLCVPDGSRLNEAARGYSRVPLHRCNLGPATGDTKRWDYWAILAGDLVVSSVYSDIDVLGLADVYWVDLATGRHGGRSIVVGPDDGIRLPDVPATAPLVVSHDHFDLSITDSPEGTRIVASWREEDGELGRLDVTVEHVAGLESVNVVIPWSDRLFNFTSKQQARPARGELVVGTTRHEIGAAPEGAWGVLDVGRGRWPHVIDWNWGGGAGRVDGHVVGLQFGAKWTAGTGFTENGVVVDGRLSKIGRELDWVYSWDAPMEPWEVIDPGGQLAVVLRPRYDKVTDVEAGPELSSRVHQVFGTWSGYVVTDDGQRVEFEGLQGFAEEARQRW